MPLISTLELTLTIPKLIELVLFVTNILLINNKNKGTKWRDRTKFHQFFLLGMISWSVYIFLDIIVYTCAGLSMDAATPIGIYQGYDSFFPSLYAINILRDIGFVASIVMSWSYLIAAFALRYDEEKVEGVFTHNSITLFLMGAITVIISAGDIIQVSVTPEGINVSGVFNGFAGLSIALNVLIHVVSSVILFITLKTLTSDDPSKTFQQRIRYFMWGVICMGLGHIYWLVLGLISIFTPAVLFLPTAVYYYLGHGLWTISPVLIYLGFGKGKKNEGAK